MSNPTKVAEDVKQLVGRFQALVDLADLLESLGSVEQAARDAESRRDVAYQAADDAQAALDVKLLKVAQAQADAQAAVAKALEAKESAGLIRAQVLSQASDDAQDILLKAGLQRKGIDEATNSAAKDLGLLNDAVRLKQEELAQVQAQVDAIKAQVSALVRG